MKVIDKKLLGSKNNLRYARTEVSILKKVKHPFVLSLYFAFQTPANLYMVVDYCARRDLAQLLLEATRLSLAQTRFFMAEIVLALEALHAHGVLYRDLKPSNVLVDAEGHVKLADFGLSREHVRSD